MSYNSTIVRWGLHLLDGGGRSGYRNSVSTQDDEAIARSLQEQLYSCGSPEEYHCDCEYSEEKYSEEGQAEAVNTQDEEVQDPESSRSMTTSYANDEAKANDEAIANALTEEFARLDGEVGRRLTHMESIPHVLKINGEIPSADDASLDHERLLDRLRVYGLTEHKICGDGNCQFRALSDQFYRTPDHHMFVRKEVVKQLKQYPEPYEGYVPMGYSDYVKKMSRNGEWGDHVTLQAAADAYGMKICLITSFRDTCIIDIVPKEFKSERVIFLSFWAEVHYNSVYPEGEAPVSYTVRKKRHWFSFWHW